MKALFSMLAAFSFLQAQAGIAGRKGVSDDQLLAATVALILLFLAIGYSREIFLFIKRITSNGH